MTETSRSVTLVAIDPGSKTLGLSVLEYDLDADNLTVVWTKCLNTELALRHHQYMIETYGTHWVRLKIIRDYLKECLAEWTPDFVIMETPFMGSFAQAFKVLVDVMGVIETCTQEYSLCIPLYKIDPSSVKKFVGVKGNSSDKSLMLAALKKLKGVTLADGVDLDAITEHEVDAILIGHYQCRNEIKPMG